jgi:hypothetical protein
MTVPLPTGCFVLSWVVISSCDPRILTRLHLSLPLTKHVHHRGKLGVGGNKVEHWVLITGISQQWEATDRYSPWNWVRIFNPFDNDTEYYWWKDFRDSWGFEGSKIQYDAVIIRPGPPTQGRIDPFE